MAMNINSKDYRAGDIHMSEKQYQEPVHWLKAQLENVNNNIASWNRDIVRSREKLAEEQAYLAVSIEEKAALEVAIAKLEGRMERML